MNKNINVQKKISFFLPNLGSGGLTRVILLLVGSLIDRGFEVDLVMNSRGQSQDLLRLLPAEANVVKLKSKRTITSIIPLAKYLKSHKRHVLISGGPDVNSIAVLAKILSRSSVKLILTEHSMPSFNTHSTKKFKGEILNLLTKRLYPKADHIVAVSDAVAKDLSKFINYPYSSIKVIYNPIVSPTLIEQSHVKVDHPWLVDKSSPVIMFVGRLVSMKNILLIIKAFSILNSSMDSKLIIVGEGPGKESIMQMISCLDLTDKVDLIGYHTNPYKYMRLADVVVLASEWEGLPTVLIESMAFNTPVIATNNLEGAIEIIDNGKFGVLSDSDEESLAAAMISVLDGTKSFDNIVERSKDFNLEASIDKYVELIVG